MNKRWLNCRIQHSRFAIYECTIEISVFCLLPHFVYTILIPGPPSSLSPDQEQVTNQLPYVRGIFEPIGYWGLFLPTSHIASVACEIKRCDSYRDTKWCGVFDTYGDTKWCSVQVPCKTVGGPMLGRLIGHWLYGWNNMKMPFFVGDSNTLALAEHAMITIDWDNAMVLDSGQQWIRDWSWSLGIFTKN